MATLDLSATASPAVFYLGIEHGLSNNEVICIYQSRNGYMWFGSFDGLNWYDGYSIRTFRKKIGDQNSLVNNSIQDIAEGAENYLWIATMGGIYTLLKNKFSPCATAFTVQNA